MVWVGGMGLDADHNLRGLQNPPWWVKGKAGTETWKGRQALVSRRNSMRWESTAILLERRGAWVPH